MYQVIEVGERRAVACSGDAVVGVDSLPLDQLSRGVPRYRCRGSGGQRRNQVSKPGSVEKRRFQVTMQVCRPPALIST